MKKILKGKQNGEKITRRKFLQVSLIGGTALGIGADTFNIWQVTDEEELRGLKLELSDGSIVAIEIPEKFISKKEISKIVKKIAGKKVVFPEKIGNLKFSEFKARDFFDLYFKPSEIFLAEFFAPESMGDFVYENTFIYQDEIIFMDLYFVTAIAIFSTMVIAVFMLIFLVIAYPIMEESSLILKERNDLIQQALWNLGEFPIFIESPRGKVSIKLIDLPEDIRIEIPARHKMISIPVETDFGTFVRNYRFPEKEIGEEFYLRLFEYVDPKTGDAIIPIKVEGEQMKVIVPKEILENFEMLKKRLDKK